MISSGAAITVDRDNDKNPVVALREIAEETLSPEDLREELIHSLQKHVEVDEPEADNVPRDRRVKPATRRASLWIRSTFRKKSCFVHWKVSSRRNVTTDRFRPYLGPSGDVRR